MTLSAGKKSPGTETVPRQKTICILAPYFGAWPEWFDLYLETCRWNPSINWKFFTDCAAVADHPPNVEFTHIQLDEYCRLISDRLGVDFSTTDPYKLCDVRPMLGLVHATEIQAYDIFGYGDIDVFYGNIRSIYTEEVLTHTCISSHQHLLSGHLALFANCDLTRRAFEGIDNWKQHLQTTEYLHMDERHQTRLYMPSSNRFPINKIADLFDPLKRNSYFKEQFTTPLTKKPWLDGSHDHPDLWTWKNGKLTNNKDGDREFLYLHFMNWRSARYLPNSRGSVAAWSKLPQVNFVSKEQMQDGWTIGPNGIHPLSDQL